MQSGESSLKIPERLSNKNLLNLANLSILLAVFVIDRVLKYFALSSGLEYTINQGLAMSIFSHNSLLSIVISISGMATFIFFIFFVMRKSIENIRKINAIIAIIIGSALSNLLDRFIYGGVVDYISVLSLPKANFADYLIVMSVLYILFSSLFNNNVREIR